MAKRLDQLLKELQAFGIDAEEISLDTRSGKFTRDQLVTVAKSLGKRQMQFVRDLESVARENNVSLQKRGYSDSGFLQRAYEQLRDGGYILSDLYAANSRKESDLRLESLLMSACSHFIPVWLNFREWVKELNNPIRSMYAQGLRDGAIAARKLRR